MSNLRELMREFVERSAASEPRVPDALRGLVRVRAPIEQEPSGDWDELDAPSRLVKRYAFDDRSKAIPFAEMLADHGDAVMHVPTITITGADVTVVIDTEPGGSGVTARDHELAAMADMIRDDVERGWPHYVRSNEHADISEVAADLRDRLNVGYTDEQEAYERF